jgi:hypothetical protein
VVAIVILVGLTLLFVRRVQRGSPITAEART